jgi:cytochrome c biogenesis protein CcmG/thiol:disulfide interchange protein DsbE
MLLATLFILTGPARAASTPMPDFSLVSAEDGSVLDSKTLKGKVLLINFFATWCPPCRQEIPDLIKFHDKYGPQGFMVIGISTDQEGAQLLKKFIQKMKINYPVLMAAPNTPYDFGNIIGIPTNFLVDRSGQIVKRYDGYVDRDSLEQVIISLLTEK